MRPDFILLKSSLIYTTGKFLRLSNRREPSQAEPTNEYMQETIETDVIIVGAGPTGLALGCQLIRYGVDFVIFDQKESITDLSKAIAVQARTLEIYEQIGLADQAVAQGAIAERVNLITGGEVRGSIELSDIGKDLSPYPFALLLEQSKNEQLLFDYLTQRGQNVLWQTALQSVLQTSDAVTATIKTANGNSQEIKAKYLVGCDGAKSVARHQLNFKFEGNTIDALFYVADVEMDFAGSHNSIYVCFGADSFVAFFPLKGENRWRLVGNLPDDADREDHQIDYDLVEEKIKREVKLPLDIKSVKWFSVYRVHSRRVDKFSDGRCFLAGDAAHIHTPAGGQGMNTGIGDAYNLAWKLALVLKDWANPALLDTYNTERLENAKHLLATTDRLFNLGTGDDYLTSFIRTYIFPFVAEYALRLDLVKQTVFPILSQIGINYRHSALSVHEGDAGFKIKAGDRMPYLALGGKSIYDFLLEPKFHFLVFSNEAVSLAELKSQTQKYGEYVDFQSLPLNSSVAEMFGTEKPFSVLLRPDNYIGFVSADISAEKLKVYPFFDESFRTKD